MQPICLSLIALQPERIRTRSRGRIRRGCHPPADADELYQLDGGHLANQEHRYWVTLAQQKNIVPDLYNLVGYGKPATTPALGEMWDAWRKVTAAADEYLDTLTPETMQGYLLRDGKPVDENVGTLLMRNIYHYWYHTGEAAAVRQMLGHTNLPEFVGDINVAAYRPEA